METPRKALALLILFLLFASCSTDGSLPEPTQASITVNEPTTAPTLTDPQSPTTAPATPSETLKPTEIESKAPAPSPTVLQPTPEHTATTEDPKLDLEFVAAVENYVLESWEGWDTGVLMGQCLIENASLINDAARNAVIVHGIDEAFSEIDGDDLASLSSAWDICDAEAASVETETSKTSEELSNPDLDAAFSEAVENYLNSTWSGWEQGQSLGQCLIITASSMTTEAKQGVIEYGIEEAIAELSGTHLQSLRDAWSNCESEAETYETITTEEQEQVSSEETSSSRVTINLELAPAPTFISLDSYSQFEDSHQLAFKNAVDTEFDPIVEKAGISVAVYSSGKMWQYAKGIAGPSTEMKASTPIEIKSTSKTFMSALILDQVEEGLYSLSDTVSSALADHPMYASVDQNKINPEVTISELLTMRSGLNTYHAISENFVAIETNPEWVPIEHLNMTPGGYENPGNYKYNDTNTIILAIIAEHAAGKPLNYLYKSKFLDPLGISAGLLPQDSAPPGTADEYGDLTKCGDDSGFGRILDACSWYTKDEWLLSQGKHNWAAAGIISTADNMARWAYELYSSQGSALSASARSQLLNSGSNEPVLFANKTHDYGYHVAIYSMDMISGSTMDIYGHIGGGGKSVMYYAPDLDLSVSILANSSLDHGRGTCANSMPFCILSSIYEAYAQ